MGLFGNLFSPAKQTQRDSFVWQPQVPFLTGLYQDAQNLGGQQAGIGPAAQQLSSQLMGGLGGWGSPMANPALANLMGRAGTVNPYMEAQVQSLSDDIGRFMNQNIGGGLANRYGYASFGGNPARGQVAGGELQRSALDAFTRGAADLRSQGYGQGQQAAYQAGALGSDLLGQQGSIFNLGMAPYQAAWMPLQMMAEAYGGPAILGAGGYQRGAGLGYSGLSGFLGGFGGGLGAFLGGG